MARPRKATPAEGLVNTPEPAATPAEGLVAVQKGGEVLHVHPTCVKAHENAGWTVVE